MPLQPPQNPYTPSLGTTYGGLTFTGGGYDRIGSRPKGKPWNTGDNPAVAAPRRPVWRLRIYWDGDANPPIEYSDFTHEDLAADAELRVLNWGQLVQSSRGELTFDTFRFTLDNLEDATSGLTVSDEWGVGDPPEGKKVTLAVKVIQPEAGPTSGFLDLFTGRIAEVPRVDETAVEIICSTKAETIDRDLLEPIMKTDWPNAPSTALARFQPLVFGEVFDFEPILVDAIVVGVLAASMTSTATTATIEPNSGLSTSGGSFQIDDEQMTYVSITLGGTKVNGIARGANGTTATDHPAGSEVIELDTVTYLVSEHPCTSISNVRLVDEAGNIRQMPDDVTVTINAGTTPATIVLSKQPTITNLTSSQTTQFKFVDLDTPDLAQSILQGIVPTQEEVEKVLGASSTFVDTNYVTLANGAPVDEITGYRAADIVGIPEGAVLRKAYAVVEGFNDGSTGLTKEATTTSTILATTPFPFTLNVDDTTGFISPATTAIMFIGEEMFVYTSKTATSFAISGRGQNTLGPQDHPIGSTCRQGPANIYVRNPNAGVSTTIATADIEGCFNTVTDTPEDVNAATGLIAVSKGFEDAHTHVIPGDHTHATDTAHTHTSTDIVTWIPDIIESRSAVAPGAVCTIAGEGVDWAAHQVREDLSDAVDGFAGSSAPITYLGGPGTSAGHYFLRTSSAALAVNDDRDVSSLQITLQTSLATPPTPAGAGLTTVEWVNLSGPCQFNTLTSGSTVGQLHFDIGTNLSTAAWDSSISGGEPGVIQNGNIFSTNLSLGRGPSTYNSNPNTIYTDTWEVDVSSAGLVVSDLVDGDYGGNSASRRCWFHLQANGLDLHALVVRINVTTTTSEVSIGNPITPEDNPDTDSQLATKRSALSWFDLEPKIDDPADLIGLRFKVRNLNAGPFPDPFLVLRIFFALEFQSVTMSGDTERPTRVICDVQGLDGSRAHDYIQHVLEDSALLNQPSGTVDDSNFATLDALVFPGAGAQVEQIRALDLVQDLAVGARLLPVWQGDGTLQLTFLPSTATIFGGSPAESFTASDMLSTEAGVSRPRAPLAQLVNDIVVTAAPDFVKGGFGITSADADATSQAVYQVVRSEEEEARFVSTQEGADDLVAHRLDYGSEIPERVLFRVHLTQKAITNTGPGAIIGLESGSFVSTALQVERRVIDFGVGRIGATPFVEFLAINRGV